MRVVAALGALVVATACASTPESGSGTLPSGDRTDDPEFVSAREAARPDFETQADVLAAGVYERFVHPDSVRPARAPAPGRRPATPSPTIGVEGEDDPSTAELLGTLSAEEWYDPTQPPRPREEPRPRDSSRAVTPRTDVSGVGDISVGGDASEGPWTLQLGAYTSETGALVRIRQLERDFPDVPRWHAEVDGLWRVYLGRWADREGAELARRAIASRGFADAWVTLAP